MKTLLASLGLLIFSVCAVAQDYNTKNGFIISTESDTIHGLIKEYNDLSSFIDFRADNETEFKRYHPEQLSAFQFDGGYVYRSKNITENKKEKKVFLLCLVEGQLSLYKYIDDHHFLEKSAGDLVEIAKREENIDGYIHKSKRYIGVLKFITADCPAMNRTFDNLKYSDEDLIKAVFAYNRCIEPEKITKVHDEPTTVKIRAGIRVGAVISDVRFRLREHPLYHENFRATLGFSAGAWLNYSMGKKKSVQAELNVIKKGASLMKSGIEYHYSFTYVQLPVSVYYSFPFKKIKPFASAGAVVGYAFRQNNYKNVPDTYNQKLYKIPLDVDTGEYGFRVSIGTHLGSSQKFRLEYLFERTLTNKSGISSQITNYANSLVLSVRL